MPYKIVSGGWGEIVCETLDDKQNQKQKYKDVILTPTHCFAWNWQTNGTSHHPGIVLQDLKDVVHDYSALGTTGQPKAVIFGVGYCNRLGLTEALLEWLEEARIHWSKSGDDKARLQIFIQNTSKAINTYNRLVDSGVNVYAWIHSTC